ncbi:hypothetical protein [Kordiimonas sp.]|uniref:hypothetical protein n=1 Tax=Kordiimonas sp. TaxID=1970157 RepID=UPI003A8E8C7B
MGKLSRWLVPSSLLIASTMVLAFAVPLFLAELMRIPGEPILKKISEGQSVSDKELEVLEKALQQSLAYQRKPSTYSELGAVHLVRAKLSKDTVERAASANKALINLQASLSAQPFNAFAWHRLSAVNILLGETHYHDAVTAWRRSVEAATFEPFLLNARIHTGIILYAFLSKSEQAMLREQINFAYGWRRWDMFVYARDHGLLDWLILLGTENQSLVDYVNKYR